MTPQRILFSTAEVAEMCGVDPSTIRTWCREGRIRAMRVGGPTADWRIPKATVDELAGNPAASFT